MKRLKAAFGNYWPWAETAFWVTVFGVSYVVMQKVMHPGWTFFGI